MKSEFITAISQLAAEKNLPKEVVFDAVEVPLGPRRCSVNDG
jgi:hypothetical protein